MLKGLLVRLRRAWRYITFCNVGFQLKRAREYVVETDSPTSHLVRLSASLAGLAVERPIVLRQQPPAVLSISIDLRLLAERIRVIASEA